MYLQPYIELRVTNYLRIFLDRYDEAGFLPVVGVELLNVSHWEVGLEGDCFVEIHNGCVDLVNEQVHLVHIEM